MARVSFGARFKQAWHTSGWLPLLAVVGAGCLLLAAFILFVLPTDAGPRPLTLVIDPAMNTSEAARAWSTNMPPATAASRTLAVDVQRPDAETVHVALLPTASWNQRIDFWFHPDHKAGMSVVGTSASFASGSSATWPVYDLVGTVRLSRSDLRPDPDRPLFLAFDLNGFSAGSDAPHNGFFEIPASQLR